MPVYATNFPLVVLTEAVLPPGAHIVGWAPASQFRRAVLRFEVVAVHGDAVVLGKRDPGRTYAGKQPYQVDFCDAFDHALGG